MIRLMVPAAICCCFLWGVAAADDDSVGQKLSSAKSEFVKAAEKARTELVAGLKKKADAVQKAGDLKSLEKVEAEIDAFERRAVLPTSVSTKAYEGDLKRARTRLEVSFAVAVKEYTAAGKRAEAKATQVESDAFKLRGTIEGAPARPSPAKVVGEGGITAQSEAAVAKGLAWLARQQKPNGHWEFDAKDPMKKTRDWATSTGIAILPFFAAGQTHKADGPHKKQMSDAVTWLKNDLNLVTGKFAHPSPQYMYGHAIASLALCEAYAHTADPALKAPAQAAIDFIVTSQGSNGSWGYQPGTVGDTSITGWQLQALYAAKLGTLTFPAATAKKAVGFLDRVAAGPAKAAYGYSTPMGRPGTALTAVGLWSRLHFDGWTADSPGMKEGTAGLAAPAARPKTRAQAKANSASPEMYFYYYATQVMHRAGGAGWQDWFEGPEADGARPGGMRDWLVAVQGPDGRWHADPGTIGSHCGQVGTTALAILVLETPYRYLALDPAR